MKESLNQIHEILNHMVKKYEIIQKLRDEALQTLEEINQNSETSLVDKIQTLLRRLETENERLEECYKQGLWDGKHDMRNKELHMKNLIIHLIKKRDAIE